jgi:branched-chain amino acid aminotransferase
MDGQLIPWDRATVHVAAHALHYGSSVFEGIRAYEIDHNPAIFCLNPHVDRLFNSAKIYREGRVPDRYGWLTPVG